MNSSIAASTIALAPRERARLREDWRWLLGLVVLGGIVCRFAQYAANRSFWVDEAALVLNIRSHSATQLFGTLDYDQAAPPLFMLAERGLLKAFGGSEYSLRLLPLVCGIVALVLFAMLARKLLLSPWDAFTVVLLALADRLIWHATEVKPYGTDLFVAVLLMLLAIGSRDGWSPTRRFVLVAAAASIAAWFSYPSMLVFGAIAIALIPRGHSRGVKPVPYLIFNGVAAISFMALILTVIHTQQNVSLTGYWQEQFLDLRHPWNWPLWLVRRLHSLSNYPIGASGPVILAAMIAGVVWLWRSRNWERFWILAGPIVVTLAAAAAQRYPFDGARLCTFLCPSVLLLATIGLKWWYESIARRNWIVAVAPAAFLAIVAIISAGWHLVIPRNRGHLRPVVAQLRQQVRPNDAIYVLNDKRAFLCYWTVPDDRVRWQLEKDDPVVTDRFWLVWSFSNDSGKHQFDALLRRLKTVARIRKEIYSDGAGAVLLERDSNTTTQPASNKTAANITTPSQSMNSSPLTVPVRRRWIESVELTSARISSAHARTLFVRTVYRATQNAGRSMIQKCARLELGESNSIRSITMPHSIIAVADVLSLRVRQPA